MRIIIVPRGTGAQAPRCIPFRRLCLFAGLALIGLPLMTGVGVYRLIHQDSAGRPVEQTSSTEMVQELAHYRTEIAAAKQRVDDHLDALGQRIGRVQAQVSRVNALGQRLAEMADLETAEFDFTAEPGVGGPEPLDPAPVQHKDLVSALDALERQLADKEEELAVLEALMSDRALHAKQFPRGWPVGGGWVSSGYGYRNDPFNGRRAFHAGVDIAGKPGTPIKAVADGVVTYAGVKAGYGLMVEINHGNGYVTRYAHALAKLVEVGERISKGEFIAVIGSSGRSTGTHLHFEVIRNGRNINPRGFLNAKG
jgi:murein DD-endopeptidase MepM/ murein hydrolase activator NlpD